MVIIELPFPDKSLNPNQRLGKHWAATHKAKTCAKQEGRILALRYRGQITGEAMLTLEIYPPDRRKRDRDNIIASLKHHLDGIADGLGIDDSQFNPLLARMCEPVKLGKIVVKIGEPVRAKND